MGLFSKAPAMPRDVKKEQKKLLKEMRGKQGRYIQVPVTRTGRENE